MGGSFDIASNQSINLGTTVNLSGGNDGGSLTAFFIAKTLSDARFINKSVDITNAGQTLQLGISNSSGGQIKGIIGQTSAIGDFALSTGVLHFAACTYDGANVKAYHGNPATGVLTEVASTAKTGNVAQDARNTRIGSSGHSTSVRPFDGRLMDIRIGDEGWTVNELTSIMNQHGHDTVKRGLRYRWRIAEERTGAIGGSKIINIGPIGIAKGSGTNDPIWVQHPLTWMPQPL